MDDSTNKQYVDIYKIARNGKSKRIHKKSRSENSMIKL